MLHRRIATALLGAVVLCAMVMTPCCKGDSAPAELQFPTTVALLSGEKSLAVTAETRPSEFTPWRAEDTPEGVLAVLGVTSVRDLLVALTALGAQVAPGKLPSDLASEVTEGLRQGFGFTDVSWLVRKAPVYIIVVDPIAYPGVALLVLPVGDERAVQETYGRDARRDLAGHAAVWDHRGEPVCVDFLPGHVIVSRDLKAYGDLKSFIAREVLRWTPQPTVALALETRRIQDVFADELADFKVGLETDGGEGMDPWLACGARLALSLIESTDQLMIGLGLRDGSLEATVAMRGERGSDYEVLTRAMQGRQAPAGTALPEDAWLVSLSDVDLRQLRVFDTLERHYLARLGMTDPDDRAGRAQAMAFFERLRGLETGPSTVALYREGSFPFAMLLTSEVTDTAALRKLSDDLIRRVFLHLRDAIESTLSSADIDAGLEAIPTLEAFIPVFNDAVRALGVETSLVEQVKGGVSVRGVRVVVDWEKTGLRELDPAFFETLRDTLGPRVEFAQAIGADRMAIAFGPTGIDTARQAVTGVHASAAPNHFRANQGEAFAIRMRLDEGLRAFDFLPVFEEIEELASLGSDEALTLGVSARRHGLVGTARLPLSLLKALVDLTL